MTNLIECSAAAYSCPLLIKNLLNSALIRAPEQEIVYRSQARFSYRDFRDREAFEHALRAVRRHHVNPRRTCRRPA